MKKITKSKVLAGVLLLATFGLASLVSAQTTPSLTCSVSPSSATVSTNQTVTLTATGGTGTYSWSGPNVSSTGSGSQLQVSYALPGNYVVTAVSGNQSANCFVNVTSTTPGTPGGTLICTPGSQSANVGQTINVSASGADGTYSWSSADVNITNPIGTGFVANYGTPGIKTLTVRSAGQTAICTINVLGTVVIPPPVTPSLPNTGGGFGK